MEGVVFRGYFLAHDEFIQIFTKYYTQTEKELNRRIITLLNTLQSTEKNKKQKYKAWERFSQTYFLNQETQILFGFTLNGKEKYSWSKIDSQKKALSDESISMARAKFNDVIKKKAAEDLEKKMQDHLNNLLKSINKKPDDKDQVLINKLKPKRKNKTGTYKEQIYGNDSKNTEGQILDAYLNHIAEHHTKILDYLTNINKYSEDDLKNWTDKIPDIKEKEGKNFVPLLTNSLNNYKWYGGGDIIVCDENRKVIYNIQLKTSTSNKSQSYHISFKQLIKVLEDLRSKKTPNEKAERLYQLLKNEAVGKGSDKLDISIDQIVADLVKPLTKIK